MIDSITAEQVLQEFDQLLGIHELHLSDFLTLVAGVLEEGAHGEDDPSVKAVLMSASEHLAQASFDLYASTK